MPTPTISPVVILALADWARHYVLAFGNSFVEFSATSPPTVSSINVTSDPGITVGTAVASGAGVNLVVTLPISGGTAGTKYNISVEVTLSTGDILSIPISYQVTTPAAGGISPKVLAKRIDWDRHYNFIFGTSFAEFTANPPATIATSPAPVFTCQPAQDSSTLTGGTPAISGTNVIVFISGGHAGQTYNVSVRITLNTGDVVSLPGVIVCTN